MTLEDVYGTRPDLLPRSMVQVARGSNQEGRLLAWQGRPGVSLLSLAEHLEYERASLGRYPRNSDGTIAWGDVSNECLLFSAEAESIGLSELIEQFMPTADSLVFFWSSLAMPSVKMKPELAISQSPAIEDSIPEFWIYSPQEQLIMESSFSGTVTVAHIPTEGMDRNSS